MPCREVRYENFPVSHTLFQLPVDELKKTLRNHEFILGNFQYHFGDIELSTITSEGIPAFTESEVRC